MDGLYAHWGEGRSCGGKSLGELGYDCYEATPFVQEGAFDPFLHGEGDGSSDAQVACAEREENPKALKGRDRKKAAVRNLGAKKKVIWWNVGNLQLTSRNEHVE